MAKGLWGRAPLCGATPSLALIRTDSLKVVAQREQKTILPVVNTCLEKQDVETIVPKEQLVLCKGEGAHRV